MTRCCFNDVADSTCGARIACRRTADQLAADDWSSRSVRHNPECEGEEVSRLAGLLLAFREDQDMHTKHIGGTC